MLNEFITWWLAELMALVPERLRRRETDAADALVVVPETEAVSASATPMAATLNAHGVTFLLRRRRRETQLGRFVLDEPGRRAARQAIGGHAKGGTVVLHLPGWMLLERRVVLPLAAEREIERVVQYEMDRFTPFAAEEVLWTAAIERRDRANGRLHVLVSLVPRLRLAPLLDALAQAGVVPGLLEAPIGDGTLRRISAGHPDPRRARVRRALVAGAALCCLILFLTAVALPFLRQSAASAEVEARIDSLRPRVAEAEALRKRIANETNGSDVIAAEAARNGNALQAIAALTDILPDDTFLTALALHQRKITMEGQSPAAAKLIGALSADPVIRNAAFGAPVTRNTKDIDVFSIRAELGP